MTVLNTWVPVGPKQGAAEEAYVQCDFCLPPRLGFGERTGAAFRDWRFDDFEAGPHRCPWCAKVTDGVRLWPEEPHPALPNLLVIGAAKCGTSALHRYLSLHPDIFMPEVKELKFFQDPNCLNRLEAYAAAFDGSVPVRGEATPIYTCHPLLPGVPERIREAVPDVKLIYLVRDPVERAIATYVEAVVEESETRDIEEAFRYPDDPFNVYTAQSRYASQYEQFARCFPPEQILVIEQTDLLERRLDTLRRVFRFLEVDDDFSSPGFEDRVNTRDSKVRRTALGKSLRTTRLAHAVRGMSPGARDALLRPARRLTSSPIAHPEPSDELRRRLSAALRGEVERLRGLTGVSVATPSG